MVWLNYLNLCHYNYFPQNLVVGCHKSLFVFEFHLHKPHCNLSSLTNQSSYHLKKFNQLNEVESIKIISEKKKKSIHQDSKTLKSTLPTGQSINLHGLVEVSVFVSLQLLPPKSGGGLSQVLVCVWNPSPQASLQSVQSDQSVQLPSKINLINWMTWNQYK